MAVAHQPPEPETNSGLAMADRAVTVGSLLAFLLVSYAAYSWQGVLGAVAVMLTVYEWAPALMDRWRAGG